MFFLEGFQWETIILANVHLFINLKILSKIKKPSN